MSTRSSGSNELRAIAPGLPSERLSEGRLPRVMRSRDMVTICLITVMLISNVSLVAGAGGAGFIYWAIGFCAFLIPSALICAQLYRLFPGEGAVYLWANKAFGSFWDSFVGLFCNWLPGVLGMLIGVSSFVTYIQALNLNWLVQPWQQGLAEVIVLVLALGLCSLGLRRQQNIINVVVLAYVGIFVLLGLAGLIWLAGGHAPQGDFSAQGWHIGVANWPVFGVVIICMFGMEVPLNLGNEVADQRSIGAYLFWGVVITIAGYLIATFAITVVLPPQDAVNPALIAETFPKVFGPVFGGLLQTIVNLILVAYFVCVTATFNMMFSRLLMLGGVDRRLPRSLQNLNRKRIPLNAMVVQTVINILLVLVIYFVAPAFAPSNQELSLVVFLVTINGASVIWNIAMIGLFLCGILLFVRYGYRLVGKWIIPPILLHLGAVLGIACSCFAIYSTLFAGSPIPQVLSNTDWIYWMFLVVLSSLAVGAAYSFLVPEAEDLIALLGGGHSSVSTTGPTQVAAPRAQPGALGSVREDFYADNIPAPTFVPGPPPNAARGLSSSQQRRLSGELFPGSSVHSGPYGNKDVSGPMG